MLGFLLWVGGWTGRSPGSLPACDSMLLGFEKTERKKRAAQKWSHIKRGGGEIGWPARLQRLSRWWVLWLHKQLCRCLSLALALALALGGSAAGSPASPSRWVAWNPDRQPSLSPTPPKTRLLLSLPRCHSGYMGARCELADLLAVVADTQKKQTITALVVVSIVASIVVIMVCVLIHCCRIRKHCEWCRTMVCRQEKPPGLLKGATSCCHSETGKATVSVPIWRLSFQTIRSWFCQLASAKEEGWRSSRRRQAGK
uniref:Transforming growth factor alpha n=1 Tax=Naja naja TaxID=35670 RepID=A0A8C6VMZ7_NAJNA